MVHLFQVGVGSGGIVVLDLLARDPRVGRVTLVDPDVYGAHNVHRHLFPPSAVGRAKAELAAEWVRERRPDVAVDVLPFDLLAPEHQPALERAAAACDVGVCAADNEPAKYHFDALLRRAGKPWTLGEVLGGGIGGWAHRFVPDGPCYGCVAGHLQRTVAEVPRGPAPDYSAPGGPVAETTVPASRASIGAVAALHAARTLDLLDGAGGEPAPAFTSLLLALKRVPGVFEDAYRTYRLSVPRSPACLLCTAIPAPAAGEALDVALDQALARLGNE